MKLFFAYLSTVAHPLAAFAVFGGVFALLFTLYGLPLAAVGYGAVICAFLGALFLLLGFLRFRRKHLALLRFDPASPAETALPPASGAVERDYARIVRALVREKDALVAAGELRYTQLADYYTVWAHQIKTPIAAMRLQLQGAGDEAQELLSELQRIEQYVEMVLCYLQLDSGGTDYVLRRCDLDKLLRQSLRKYAPQFIRKKIRLVYEPVYCSVLTDEKWLSFVVEQLLSNALKYTRAGSITVTLEPGEVLCIRDTGIGIAPEDLPRLGERGFTGGNGRDDKRATGIGLYLCRRILRNLGHSFAVESQVGVGTAVRVGLARNELETE